MPRRAPIERRARSCRARARTGQPLAARRHARLPLPRRPPLRLRGRTRDGAALPRACRRGGHSRPADAARGVLRHEAGAHAGADLRRLGPGGLMLGIAARVQEIKTRATTLARLQLELATLELKRKGKAIAIAAVLAIIALVVVLYAIGFIFAAIAAGIAEALPLWASLLIVSLLLLLTAAVLLYLAHALGSEGRAGAARRGRRGGPEDCPGDPRCLRSARQPRCEPRSPPSARRSSGTSTGSGRTWRRCFPSPSAPRSCSPSSRDRRPRAPRSRSSGG